MAKWVDEVVESAVVRTAQGIVRHAQNSYQAYDQLVDLLERQPSLNVRSSTSVLQQAYSTPVPISYLGSVLAGLSPQHTVYEPAAGHGALLLNCDPAKATVNELNPDRAADLRAQGYEVTEHDAALYQPTTKHDVIIANPPFGRVRGSDGRPRHFEMTGSRRSTSQIDQAIAFKALDAMKDDGRGVLILGGKLTDDESTRSEAYNTLESRSFFKALYDQYRVVEHITVWGALYRKQGAGFPIDLIVVHGRGKSSLSLPAADVPPIYKSFSELKELLPYVEYQRSPSVELPPVRFIPGRLDAETRGRPGAVSSEDSPRLDADGLADLSSVDAIAPAISDFELDESAGRKSGGDTRVDDGSAQPTGGGRTAESIRDESDSDSSTPNTLGLELGGEANRRGSNVDRDVLGREQRDRVPMPDSTPNRDERSPRADGTPRHHHAGELARMPDDERLELISPELQQPQGGVLMEGREERNVLYIPRSNGRSPGTLIPSNMETAAQRALDRVERRRGDIDQFVQDRLGYTSREQLHGVLYAEQIDSLALSFDQQERGMGFLNADQTGNGKGRFGAASIIDAKRRGYIPVFVTQKPNLYNAMLTDLTDIGFPGITPFVTNNNLTLDLDDGRQIKTYANADQELAMLTVAQEGLGAYDAIFTTYDQLQTLKSQEPYRRHFLRTIAPRAVFIFDEAHEAGGSTNDQSWKKRDAAPNRAEFVRSLVNQAAGVVFMSATATKEPAVMDLYARRTEAVNFVDLGSLKSSLKSGGIPIQQYAAVKFVAAGHILRRERSFEGISFEARKVPVDRDVADGISAIMRSIAQFDKEKDKALADLEKEHKKEAKKLSIDNSVGAAGIQSTNFTSLMHNAIDQALLAQKAEATVQDAIQAMKRDQKPIIALASTMDSFIDWYAKENNLEPGDLVDISFTDVLDRYLERSREYLIADHDGLISRERLTDGDLGLEGVEAYEMAKELIETTDLSAIPLSPIDYIKWRLSQEGVTVDEITGRQNILEYDSQGKQRYAKRSAAESKPRNKVKIVNRFNDGSLDVVLLNRSGATGISLHASEKFQDQRQRYMIVAQAERDINQAMQMFGRVNRFGQVVEPQFVLLASDLPAEKRLGAILSKKMASLNANTTASRDSDLSPSDVIDFMNEIGEEIIAELLEGDPGLEAKLSFPSRNLQGESSVELISRVTGRIPLLAIAEQEELYQLIESEVTDLIQQKEALGENPLQAGQLNLDARTVGRMEVIKGEGSGEFGGSVYLEVVDARVPVKPPTQLDVIKLVRESLELAPVSTVDEHRFQEVAAVAKQWGLAQYDQVVQQAEAYKQQALKGKSDPEIERRLHDRITAQLTHIGMVLERFPPGTPIRVESPQGQISDGVITRISPKGHKGSPAAPTNWRVHILTAQAQSLQIPLSKFNTGRTSAVSVAVQEKIWNGTPVYRTFDDRQSERRTTRQIFTGDLLKAHEQYANGRFINYTDNKGMVRQGLIMPASFDIEQDLRQKPVRVPTPDLAKAILNEVTKKRGTLQDKDKTLALKVESVSLFSDGPPKGYIIQTPKASSVGGKYFLNEALQEAVGNEFISISDRMEVKFTADRLDAVLNVLMTEMEAELYVHDDFKQLVRDYLGAEMPTLEIIEEMEKEPYVPYVPEPSQLDISRLEAVYEKRSLHPTLEAHLKTISEGEWDDLAAESGQASEPFRRELDQILEQISDQLYENVPLESAVQKVFNNRKRSTLSDIPERLLQRQAPQPTEPSATPQPNEPKPPTEPQPSTPSIQVESVESEPEPVVVSDRLSVLPSRSQRGGVERSVAKFLADAGISETIMEGESFHLSIENEPYIPLVVERHSVGEDKHLLYLTHYLESHGDKYIDTEMVLKIQNGFLSFQETAVQNPVHGGESRTPDRTFALIFARNISKQGFASAAREAIAAVPVEVVAASTEPSVQENLDQSIAPMPEGQTTGREAKANNLAQEVLSYLNTNEIVSLGELRRTFGAPDYDPERPLDNPVHQALKRLRDEGAVEVKEQDWGEPRFRLSEMGRTLAMEGDRQVTNQPEPETEALNADDTQLYPATLEAYRVRSPEVRKGVIDEYNGTLNQLESVEGMKTLEPATVEVQASQPIGWLADDSRLLTYEDKTGRGSLLVLSEEMEQLAQIFQQPLLEPQIRQQIATIFKDEVPPEKVDAVVDAILSHRQRFNPKQSETQSQANRFPGEDTPTIRHNLEKNGIEVQFASKPDDKAIFEHLKALNFRFSGQQELWWVKYSETRWQKVHDYFGMSPQTQQSEVTDSGVSTPSTTVSDRQEQTQTNVAAAVNRFLQEAGLLSSVELTSQPATSDVASLGVEPEQHGQALPIQDQSMPNNVDSSKRPQPEEMPHRAIAEVPVIEQPSPTTVDEPSGNRAEATVSPEMQWISVRQDLVETGLPAPLIDRLHERGLVRADEKNRADFVRHELSEATWQRGNPSESGWFWLGSGKGNVQRVFLTQSPVEALSLAILDKEKRPPDAVTVYLAQNESGQLPLKALQQVLDQGGRIALAFDNNHAGEQKAWDVARSLPGARRIQPEHLDWNQQLRSQSEPLAKVVPAFSADQKETLRSLWRFHSAGRAQGMKPEQLARITEIAKAYIHGEPVPEKARAVMQRVLHQSQVQAQQGRSLQQTQRQKMEVG
ncbi:strawberry notch C-terminal domain-containing protein [Oculatella sp. LEGE 06141]